jgi:hypothetical protein
MELRRAAVSICFAVAVLLGTPSCGGDDENKMIMWTWVCEASCSDGTTLAITSDPDATEGPLELICDGSDYNAGLRVAGIAQSNCRQAVPRSCASPTCTCSGTVTQQPCG